MWSEDKSFNQKRRGGKNQQQRFVFGVLMRASITGFLSASSSSNPATICSLPIRTAAQACDGRSHTPVMSRMCVFLLLSVCPSRPSLFCVGSALLRRPPPHPYPGSRQSIQFDVAHQVPGHKSRRRPLDHSALHEQKCPLSSTSQRYYPANNHRAADSEAEDENQRDVTPHRYYTSFIISQSHLEFVKTGKDGG